MNLAVLKRTRRAPEVGDIFVMQPPDGQFLFGRVIDTNADPLGVGGAVLIYVYRVRAAAMTPVPATSWATAGPAHDDEQEALDARLLRAGGESPPR